MIKILNMACKILDSLASAHFSCPIKGPSITLTFSLSFLHVSFSFPWLYTHYSLSKIIFSLPQSIIKHLNIERLDWLCGAKLVISWFSGSAFVNKGVVATCMKSNLLNWSFSFQLKNHFLKEATTEPSHHRIISFIMHFPKTTFLSF